MYSIPKSPEAGSGERASSLLSASRRTTEVPQSATYATTTTKRTRRATIQTGRDRRPGRHKKEALPGPRPNPPNLYRSLSFVVVAPGAGVKLQRRGLRRRVYVEVAGFGVGLGEGILLIEEDLRYIVGQLLIHGLVDDEVVGDGDNGHGLV